MCEELANRGMQSDLNIQFNDFMALLFSFVAGAQPRLEWHTRYQMLLLKLESKQALRHPFYKLHKMSLSTGYSSVDLERVKPCLQALDSPSCLANQLIIHGRDRFKVDHKPSRIFWVGFGVIIFAGFIKSSKSG